MCRRAFGSTVQVASAVELGGGMYNTIYRITADSLGAPAVLRVAPAPERRFVLQGLVFLVGTGTAEVGGNLAVPLLHDTESDLL